MWTLDLNVNPNPTSTLYTFLFVEQPQKAYTLYLSKSLLLLLTHNNLNLIEFSVPTRSISVIVWLEKVDKLNLQLNLDKNMTTTKLSLQKMARWVCLFLFIYLFFLVALYG